MVKAEGKKDKAIPRQANEKVGIVNQAKRATVIL